MPDIPALKGFGNPFDSLFILWTDHDLAQGDISALNSIFADAFSEDCANTNEDETTFAAGLHTGIMSNGKVLLKHCFGQQSAGDKGQNLAHVSLLNADIFAADREIAISSKSSSIKYQKRLGPITTSNIGLKFENKNMVVVLDAALKLGPIEMHLLGFELGLNLKALSEDTFSFKISFSGLGLAVNSPPLPLAGSLEKQDALYVGGVLAEMQPYSFTAAGAYGMVNEIKTAFIILSFGGPLLNINGIMISDVVAGFGYNSDIRFPDPTSVSAFPLISIGQPPRPLAPLTIFRDLMGKNGWISAADASFWVGAGVKGSAFNMVDAKIAAVVKITNKRLSQIGIFAVCTAQMPRKPGAKLFTFIELGIAAILDLDEGTMLVFGRLSPTSFVIDSACKLTGGFAAATWFDPSPYAGDWVFSLGGYHPKYTAPAYYPGDIPRVGISWQIDERIFLRAGAYFAITPKVCMGGASILATCDVCGLHASFCARVDFLMNFDPFHYMLDLSIDIKVFWSSHVLSIWVSIGVDISASLHMCGSPVCSVFTIKVPIKNVTVEFGDNGGNNVPARASLAGFRSMLQQSGQGEKQEVKITCRSGMVSQDEETGDWTVRAGKFAFDVRSNVATTQLRFNGTALEAPTKCFQNQCN